MKSTLTYTLGLRIKELRMAKGIKQCALADKLNMERSNLTRIESGKQRPSDENLIKIANLLEVELFELFGTEHLETKEKLIEKITKMLPEFSENQIRFCYKSLMNLKLMKYIIRSIVL